MGRIEGAATAEKYCAYQALQGTCLGTLAAGLGSKALTYCNFELGNQPSTQWQEQTKILKLSFRISFPHI